MKSFVINEQILSNAIIALKSGIYREIPFGQIGDLIQKLSMLPVLKDKEAEAKPKQDEITDVVGK